MVRELTDTAARSSSRAGAIALAGAVLVLVALLGMLAGARGIVALGVVVGAAALFAFTRWPFIGLLVLAATIPIQNMLLIAEGTTALKLLGLITAGAWLLQRLLRRQPWGELVSRPLVWAGAAYVLLVLASMLWARETSVVAIGVQQLAQLFVFSLLVIDLCGSWERLDDVVKALVVGGGIAAVLTLQHALGGGLRRAGEDIGGGVNATAVVLVTLLPFGVYLFRAQAGLRWRLAGAAFASLAVLAVLVTYSRMNMLLLPAVLLGQYWVTLRGRSGRRWLAALTVAGVVAASMAVPWQRVADRAATIVPYLTGTLDRGGAATAVTPGSSRGYHLKVGLAIMRDHPVLGVGYGNYGHHFISRYQFEVPGSGRLYRTPRSPHSSHIGTLADLGLVGFAVWLTLLGVALADGLRAWSLTRGPRRSPQHALVQAVLFGLGLHVFAYGLYLPNQREKILWILLGMACAVGRLARRART